MTQLRFDFATATIVLLPLTGDALELVEQVYATAPAGTYLRAADALHPQIPAENGITEIHSNDKHILAAALLFGLVGVNLIP